MRRTRTHRVLGWVVFAAAGFLLPVRISAQIEVAGELFVDLDAADASAGEALWTNNGTLADFERVGEPFATDLAGAPAVTFNELGAADAYQCLDNAPAGLVGVDPTRSIEVWAYNPDIVDEETLVSWGRRGGGPGTNMSFNYGIHPAFGAVGHWDAPDIGWGTVPPAGQWNHLVYTYDGTTTRVYSNGALANSEALGPGVINTHANTRITVASQIEPDGVTLTAGLRGTLSIGRVRVHDGVLSDEQVLNNFLEEKETYGVADAAPTVPNPPGDDEGIAGATYERIFAVQGLPFPTATVIEPAGGTVTAITPLQLRFSFDIPANGSDFDVTIRLENSEGEEEVTWRVTVRRTPQPGQIAVAGELFVSLDARSDSAGTDFWENEGTLDDFERVGDPQVVEIAGGVGVSFNEDGRTADAYQCVDVAPEGLVGPDPTRTIEVWAYNPSIVDEETLVSWGRRGGPAGTNMSFNYGVHAAFGAVGHWDAPDIGWFPGITGAPAPERWHHLVYTYDGTTTRVYADGAETNSEVLGAGVINTHPDTRITIASQIEGDGTTLTAGLRGTMAIGRVRVHDGVLAPAEILHNYNEELDEFTPPDVLPDIVPAPGDDFVFTSTDIYERVFKVSGFPDPTVSAVAPAGATTELVSGLNYRVLYDIPDPPPGEFDVTIRLMNRAGQKDVTWKVTVRPTPGPKDPVEIAGELFVLLDAYNETAGDDVWENGGTLDDFVKVGLPELVEHDGAPALSFNSVTNQDAYESVDLAPAGIVGPDPTRTIEVWAYNPSIVEEETLVAWGHRGGPNGTNMSFNYGNHVLYGAVGHWGGDGPDIGWGGSVPPAGQWNHLTYTYDGLTTRVYVNGALANSEFLGLGALNTYADTKIAVAQQYVDNVALDFSTRSGALSIGRIRIHDGVLRQEQIQHNHDVERSEFPLPPPPEPEPLTEPPVHRYSFAKDANDSIGTAHGVVFGNVSFADGLAVLGNDGSQNSNSQGQSPPAPPPGAYIDLPNGIISALGDMATFEAWTTWNGPVDQSWQRIFDFGESFGGEDFSDGAALVGYIFLTPRSGDNTLRYGYRSPAGAGERNINTARLTEGVEHHVVVVWNGAETRATLYVDGLKYDEDLGTHFALSELNDINNWLGRSQWPDAMYNGSYNEFRIYDYPLTTGQVFANFGAGPDRLNGIDPEGAEFVRGDTDGSGGINITDGVFVLNFLFQGGGDPPCKDAADVDNSNGINITDGVYVLNFLFQGGPDPAAPYPACGVDADEDTNVDCATPPASCSV